MKSGVLLHDEGEIYAYPYYLLQFTEWAAETGLAYVADTELRLDWLEMHPPPLKAAFVGASMPRIKALQYSDYLFNTTFRRSLVCRAEDAGSLRPTLNLAGVMDLRVVSRLAIDGPAVCVRGAPGRYRVPDADSDDRVESRVVEIKNQFVKAVFNELALQRNHLVSMARVWQRVVQNADPKNGDPDDAVEEVGRSVLTAVCKGQMRIFSGPYPGG